ncbi:hypothetical protein ACFL1B_03355 [Nanoarchaeota archaeon]
MAEIAGCEVLEYLSRNTYVVERNGGKAVLKGIVALDSSELAALEGLKGNPGVVNLEGLEQVPLRMHENSPEYYLVLEYIEGQNIAQAFEQKVMVFGEDAFREVIPDLARVVMGVHEDEYVLNDLKPPNVMLAPQGKKIVDLGSAFPVEQKYADAMATPGFLCLNHFDLINHTSTDVFQLGVTGFFISEGRLPYRPDDIHNRRYLKLALSNGVPEMHGLKDKKMVDLVKAMLDPVDNNRPGIDEVVAILDA